MRFARALAVLIVLAAPALLAGQRKVAVERPIAPVGDPAACPAELPATTCRESYDTPFSPLTAVEVERLARAAAAAVDDPRMTVAVVDRAGRVLTVLRKSGADPTNDDLAVGLARTAAFFSHDMAPLSSRTIRFISGVHFPPGVKRAPNAALYGIENTNRGCDLNVTFNPGKCIPSAKALRAGRCDAFDTTACGTGPVTGKPQPWDLHEKGHPTGLDLHGPRNPGGLPVDPGGVPVYRVASVGIDGDFAGGNGTVRAEGPGHLIGGIGVTGIDRDHAEFAAFAAVALDGALFPAPSFPLPAPGRVFIDGIRLPFVENGARPPGTRADSDPDVRFIVGPAGGGCAPTRYLVGPHGASRMTADEVDAIIRRAHATATRTQGLIRLPLGRHARMVFAVSDLDGEIVALYRMPDATVFSIDVAVAKARNVVYFSGDGRDSADLPGLPAPVAVTNRTIGYGAQPLYPAGLDHTLPGPYFELFLRDLDRPCSQGFQPTSANQSGVVFFAGSLPLYRNGELIGGLGVSGDGVEQDDYVSLLGAGDLAPDPQIRADRYFVRDVRQPFLKFPRNPPIATETIITPFEEPPR